jgi:hypothetical protein
VETGVFYMPPMDWTMTEEE